MLAGLLLCILCKISKFWYAYHVSCTHTISDLSNRDMISGLRCRLTIFRQTPHIIAWDNKHYKLHVLIIIRPRNPRGRGRGNRSTIIRPRNLRGRGKGTTWIPPQSNKYVLRPERGVHEYWNVRTLTSDVELRITVKLCGDGLHCQRYTTSKALIKIVCVVCRCDMTLESSGEDVREAFNNGGLDARPLRSASDSLNSCLILGRGLRALLGLLLLLLLLLSFRLSLRFSVTSAGDGRPARLLPGSGLSSRTGINEEASHSTFFTAVSMDASSSW